jgi:hypothetical protein
LGGNCRIFYFAWLTIEKGKSFFSAGPVLGTKLKMTRYAEGDKRTGQYALNGVHFVYQFNPNPKARIVDFFFQYQFVFLRYKDGGIDNYTYINNEPYQSHRTDIESFLGMGYKIKFLQNVYLTHSFGAGFIHERTLVNYTNIHDSEDTFLFVNGMVSVGLGYTFNNFKK